MSQPIPPLRSGCRGTLPLALSVFSALSAPRLLPFPSISLSSTLMMSRFPRDPLQRSVIRHAVQMDPRQRGLGAW